jgi:hypothetical protein
VSRHPARRSLVAAVFLVSACHSAPFVTGEYGAPGPYRTVAGEEQLTTGGESLLDYTPDGQGIAVAPGLCTIRLPATGGSGVWTYCVPGAPRDSGIVVPTRALASQNRLAYSRAVGPVNSNPQDPWPFPTDYDAMLWLLDSSGVRPIMQLYRASIGHAVVPADSINWVTNAKWADDSTLFVVAGNLSPADLLTQFGIAHGVVDSHPFSLAVVPGTATVRLYSPAAHGAELVFADTGLVLWKVATNGGPVTLAGNLPPGNARSISGLSCAATACTILTQEDSVERNGNILRTATLWHLDPDAGTIMAVRDFSPLALPVPSSISLSSADGDVALQQGSQVYLLPHGN